MSMGKTDRNPSDKSEIRVSGIDIQWHPEKGTCEFERLPVAMMWVDTTLAGLMSGVQAMVGTDRFVLALQSEGRKSVEADWDVISKFPDFRDGFKAIANIAAVAGWGDWRLAALDMDRTECRFRVNDSWEGRYQKALGVCWGSAMLAGKMAGYCSKLFATNCWAEQTAFIARGDACDEFVVRPSDRSLEREIENLLATDVATRADMAVALRKLEEEIGERRRVEETNRRLGAIVESTTDLVAWATADGRVRYINPAGRRMVGLSQTEELTDYRIEHAHFPEVAEFLKNEAWPVALREGSWAGETVLLTRDGREIPVSQVITAHRRGDGVLEFLATIMRDVSERRQGEEELIRSQALLYGMLDAIPDLLLVVDRDYRIVYSNYKGHDLIQPLEGVTCEKCYERFMLRGSPCEDCTARPVFETGRVVEREKVNPADGRMREVRAFPVFDSAGRVAMVVEHVRDISDRKRAEEAERRARQEWEDIFQAIGHPTVILDPEQRILMANRAMLRASGKSAEELRGQFCYQMHHAPKSTAPPTGCPLVEMLSTGHLETAEMEMDVFGGTYLVSCTPVLDEQGRLEKIIHIATDITDRKRAEAERLELERRLLDAQKLESLGILAGGIAHDFNNLLMIILGNLDVAFGDASPVSPARASIEQAMHATRRAADLTRQLLAYSGRGQFEIMRIDLNDLLREDAELFRAAVSRTVTMNFGLAAEPCVIEADPGQIQQVVMNLVTNASESVGEAPGIVTLVTGLQECDEAYLSKSRLQEKPAAGRFAYLEVSDTCCGMDDEAFQKMFDPFFTTKFTGRGLGMSAVLGVVRGHKGAIVVESAIDRGTAIRVLFPVAAEPSDERSAPSRAQRRAERPAAVSGKILVVDDEEAIRNLCSHFVQNLGYPVLEAANGKEALTLFKEHINEIACVVLDLTMPWMDGLTAFREMKNLRPDVKVILCSGYSEDDATRRFSQEDLAAFIQKPYLMRELKAKIEIALGGSGPPSASDASRPQ